MNKKILLYILVLFLASGCLQHKDLLILNVDSFSVQSPVYNEYKLRPQDLLYIRVMSSDKTIQSIFEPISEDRVYTMNDKNLYLTGYTINNDSTIVVPLLGKFKAAGLTLNQLQSVIQKKIDEMVIDTYATVKLANYKVTVLGEVDRPGVIFMSQTNPTIFDALAMVGDISKTGNRKKITVLREVNNSLEKYQVDLSDISVLNSQAYFVYPNDVIYVKPLRTRIVFDNIPIYSIFLSTITTFLLIYNVVLR